SERGVTHLRGHALVVPTAVGTEDHTTVPPLRRARRALARATRALLPPRLRAAAGDPRAVLRRARALPRVGERSEQCLEEDAAPPVAPPRGHAALRAGAQGERHA